MTSNLEKQVRGILMDLEVAGKITDLKEQQVIVLQDVPSNERITWKVDFSAVDLSGEMYYAEAKGIEDDVYQMKLKLYRKIAPHDLVIYKPGFNGPKISEVIRKKSFLYCNDSCQCSCHKK